MTWRRALAWVLFFALVALVGTRAWERLRDPRTAREPERGARVVRIVDGDTIVVELDDQRQTVRYIGVDTPESVKPNTPVQCYAKAASHANARLVGGRRVRLRFDAERRDRYGRLLAYVYRDGGESLVNAALLRRGFARTLTIPPNDAHAAWFRRLERRARDAGRGLWSACDRDS